jgi:hypothetical protein
MLALKEIRLDVYVENIAAQTLDRVIERKNVHSLSIFDVKTLVNIDEIAELDAKVVTCDLVHLYTTFFDIVGAQTDQNSIPPLLSAEAMSGSGRNCQRASDEPNNDGVPAEESKRLHRIRVECGD